MKTTSYIGAAIMTLLATSEISAAERKPNVLLIVADDLGWGELGCQGNPQIPTPNIDSLAKNGTRFTSGYVSGPYCSPTRAGLMTGRYQQRFGHEFNPGPTGTESKTFGLSVNETTLPERLKSAGYATGMFGKWHLGYQPQFTPPKRGFDEFFGFLGGAHSYSKEQGDGNPVMRGAQPVAFTHTTDDFAAEAAKFIEKHKEQPWFVYLPFNAVHSPLESTDKYLSRFSSISDPKRQKFAAMLSAMDDGVGTVLAKIRDNKLEQDTLVFFISDNGGPTAQITSGNGPLRGFKSQTWEGGVRVPFMVQWPGKIPAGKTYDQPVIQLDIHPTVLAAAGVEIKPEWKLDGVNLTPYLGGEKKQTPHEALYWRFGPQIAIRMGDWKLVKGVDGPGFERQGDSSTKGAGLYNLAKDIGEKTDLAAQEPARFKELAAAWDKWNADLIDPLWIPNRAGVRRAAANAK